MITSELTRTVGQQSFLLFCVTKTFNALLAFLHSKSQLQVSLAIIRINIVD